MTYKDTMRNFRANGTYRTYRTYGTKAALRACVISPVTLIEPEIPDCAFVSPVPPAPPGFIPCPPAKFQLSSITFKSKVGRLGGVVCRGAYNLEAEQTYLSYSLKE